MSQANDNGRAADAAEENSEHPPQIIKVIELRRVSSNEQTDGAGLDAQENINRKSREDIDGEVELVEVFEEDGVSGTAFPRATIIEILKLARRKPIDYLIVKDVSRVGRVAGPTFGFIWLLTQVYNVDIITEEGKFNTNDKTGLIHLFFESLNAEIKNRFRTSYVIESQLAAFRDGKLHVTNRDVPFGYEKKDEDQAESGDEDEGDSETGDENDAEENSTESTDDGSDDDEEEDDRNRIEEGDELAVCQEEADVVEGIFSAVHEIGPRRNVLSRVREKFETDDECPDVSQLPDDNQDIKSILRDSIYKGEPEWEIDLKTEEVRTESYEDEDLEIVSDEVFDDVQDILDDRRRRFYDNMNEQENETTDRLTLQQITSTMGLSRLLAFDDVVRIHCPSCGSEMQDNGKWRATSDIKPPNTPDIPDEPILKRYRCPNDECHREEKRFPNEYEGYLLFNLDLSLEELMEHK